MAEIISQGTAKERAKENVVNEINRLCSIITDQINELQIKLAEAEIKNKIEYGEPINIDKVSSQIKNKISNKRVELKKLRSYINEAESF